MKKAKVRPYGNCFFWRNLRRCLLEESPNTIKYDVAKSAQSFIILPGNSSQKFWNPKTRHDNRASLCDLTAVPNPFYRQVPILFTKIFLEKAHIGQFSAEAKIIPVAETEGLSTRAVTGYFT